MTIYVNKKDINHQSQVIVSLTSFPERFTQFDLFVQCLGSLVRQVTKYRYKIVITLYDADIRLVPQCMFDYCADNGIYILPCSEDLKGHKKYFYAAQKWPGLPLILVDDDFVYVNNLVDCLMDKHLNEDHRVIWTGWCQKMNLSIDGHITHSPALDYVLGEIPSFKYKFGSGSGTLLPPHLIRDFDGLLELAKSGDNIFHDELVLKRISLDAGVKVGLCKNPNVSNGIATQFFDHVILPLSDSDGNLHKINEKVVRKSRNATMRGVHTEVVLFKNYIIFDDRVIVKGRAPVVKDVYSEAQRVLA